MRYKGKTWLESHDSCRFDTLRVQPAIRERRRCNAPSFALGRLLTATEEATKKVPPGRPSRIVTLPVVSHAETVEVGK
jgi:hypothetical protein